MDKDTEIYKVVIGSHCHGLNDENSDIDYKGVFVTPTQRFFEVGTSAPKDSHKIDAENDKDSDSMEIGHFLHLATQSNPTILETFKAPKYEIKYKKVLMPGYPLWMPGEELRALFTHVWSSRLVHAAFKGYSRNQLDRMFGDKKEYSERKFKYAVAYVRVLLSGIELLVTGDFHTRVADTYNFSDSNNFPDLPSPISLGGKEGNDSWFAFLKSIRAEEVSMGAIIDVANSLRDIIDQAYEFNPNKETNLEPINKYISKVRKEFWN